MKVTTLEAKTKSTDTETASKTSDAGHRNLYSFSMPSEAVLEESMATMQHQVE